MAQNPITLEEAAQRLGLEPNEFKRLLKTDPAFKVLSQIRDGSNIRFKPAQIEELARNLGAASDPGLPLAAMVEDEPLGSDDFKLHGSDPGTPVEQPLEFGSTDDDIFSLSAEEVPPPKIKGKPDSDVRLESEKAKAGKNKGDSDVRLESPKAKGKGKDSAIVPTEEIAIDFSGPGSAIIKGGSSAKLSAPKSSGKLVGGDSGKGLAKPGTGDSSEFELSLDADSDDFELQLNTDTSDEVDLGALPKDKSGKPRAGESGINLRDPADSGISLEKKNKGKAKPPVAPDDSSDDFELSLDPGTPASGSKLAGPKSGKTNRPEPVTSDSDSEFELTLDDSGGSSSLEHAALEAEDSDKNDIFETDFEIPPMSDDSGSEAVAVETDTDIEQSDEMALNDSDVLSEDETGSQVVMLEDEEGVSVDEAVDLVDVSVEDEDEASIGAALKGVKGRRHDEDEDEPVVVGSSRPVPWGPWPAVFLLPAFLFVIIGGLVGFELMHTMWGYQQPKKPSTPIVRGIAKTLEMDIKD